MDLPYFVPGDGKGTCSGCLRCSVFCPGLAISIVDKRKAPPGRAFVFIPFELVPDFSVGSHVPLLDAEGVFIEEGEVVDIVDRKWQDKTLMIKVLASANAADRAIGIKYQRDAEDIRVPVRPEAVPGDHGENIVCRCEKVTDREIRAMVREGFTDMNSLKAIRCMMGSCGGKTCTPLIKRIFAEEGVPSDKITDPVRRPLEAEVPLGVFANPRIEEEPDYEARV